jgi:tRNA G18 (ribose-2'-O)-methylase SpoU
MGAHFRLPLHQNVQWDDLRPLLPRNSTVLVADSEGSDSVSYNTILPTDARKLNHVVLVIGGETEGLSGHAYSLLEEFDDCRRVHVPLARGVDSLNVAAAFSVIVFHVASVLGVKESD